MCQSEYDNPSSRRFHAQPNACRNCGARVWFVGNHEPEIYDEAGIRAVQQVLSSGKIVVNSTNAKYKNLDVLVMTSGNFSNEPIIKDNAEAIEKLSNLADAFLLHDREIYVPCDDSVIRVFENHELPIRRSRGYAPFPVQLPFRIPPILAVGGELKATFCVAKDEFAFVSQHIGNMENLETLRKFEKSV